LLPLSPALAASILPELNQDCSIEAALSAISVKVWQSEDSIEVKVEVKMLLLEFDSRFYYLYVSPPRALFAFSATVA
jgi:hypothetical protein